MSNTIHDLFIIDLRWPDKGKESQQMGITHKQLAGNQRRTLRAMRKRLLDMSAQWDGLDQYNMSELADLSDKCEQVAAEMVPDPVETDDA